MNSWGDILSLIPKYREERELMKQVGVEGTDNDAISSKFLISYLSFYFLLYKLPAEDSRKNGSSPR